MAGSHYGAVLGESSGHVPQVDVQTAKRTFTAVHDAISRGLARACHDLSEGGLAVAIAEMAFAGGLGAHVRLTAVPHDDSIDPRSADGAVAGLFSESASRFLVEVPATQRSAFESIFQNAKVPCGCIGEVTGGSQLRIDDANGAAIDAPLAELKEAWQKPLRW